MDLIGLLQRPEGETLEFKRDLSSPEKVLHTLIAFANTAGGLLVIGVENGKACARAARSAQGGGGGPRQSHQRPDRATADSDGRRDRVALCPVDRGRGLSQL